MTRVQSTEASKKLVLRYILENIDYKKRCLYLQEIISLSKVMDVWRQALISYFDSPLNDVPLKAFSKN